MAGKVVKHDPKFTLPIPALTTGLTVQLTKHTYGSKPWQQRRGYPTIGAGITAIRYGIDSIYGQCYSLYPTLTIPILATRRLQWSAVIGNGLAYVTSTYNRLSPGNTANVAMGSHLNDFVYLASNVQWLPHQHWGVQAGVHFTHVSNGSIRKPNLGINTYGAHAGITYYPVTAHPPYLVRELRPLPPRWLWQARMGMSLVSSYTAGGPLFPAYIATGYASRRWRSYNKLLAGADYSYHQDTYAFLRDNNLAAGQEKNNSWKSGLFVGNEFVYGRVGIVVLLGAYLKQSYLKKDALYQKVGGNFYLVRREQGPLKEVFVSAFLKTHKNVAELGELGIGIGW